jgi:hypothetical protein
LAVNAADTVYFGIMVPTTAPPPGQFIVKVAMKAPAASVYRLDLRLTYDPATTPVAQVQAGGLVSGMTPAMNTIQAGIILAGLAGANPVGGEGDVLIVTFATSGAISLQLTDAWVNEEAMTAVITSNTAPVLSAIADKGVNEGSTLSFTATATDSDQPAQTLVFTLEPGAPTGAAINASSGLFTWTPSDAQAPSTNTVTVCVTDNGSPNLSNTSSFTVVVRVVVSRVAGTVRYWKGGAGVPRVAFTLCGNRIYSGQSDEVGMFTLRDARLGTYTLSPIKSDDVRGITAYDASLVLQHAAGLRALSSNELAAADVNKSGSVTSLDASYILQKAVDLIPVPFVMAGAVWEFTPASRLYANLASDQDGQDVTALLIGNVSGNWPQARPLGQHSPQSSSSLAKPVVVGIKRLVSLRSGEAKVCLLVKAHGVDIYSVNLTVEYEPAMTSVKTVQAGALGKSLALASNLKQVGVVRAALAGATLVQGVGSLLEVELQNGAAAELQMAGVSVNEGEVPVQIDSTEVAFDADSDGDRHSDWEEIRAGTDPENRQSVFAIKGATLGPDKSWTVTWAAVPGKVYQLQFKNTVSDTEWVNVGEEVIAGGLTVSQVDRSVGLAKQGIYRVVLVE